MNKVVFATMPLQSIEPQHYVSEENKAIEYAGKIRFPVNAVLANTLKKEDKVTVVQVVTECEYSRTFVENYKEELNQINSNIGAIITYKEVVSPYKETSDIVESRFRQLIEYVEEDSTIYADMTYGPKTLIPVLFFVLSFAEKFFHADISHIVYGRILHGSDKHPISNTAKLYDVTPLYYLNSLTSVMEAPDGKTALARLDKYFAM